MMEGLCLDVLLQKVREGHTPSVRALADRLDRVAAPPPPSKGRGNEDAEGKGPPIGKKAQRLADAADPAAGYGDLYDRIHAKGRQQ